MFKRTHFNSVTNGTFWFSLSFLIQKAVSILATPIFTRIFTTEEYGTYSMYSTWLSIILVISTLNISGPVYNTLSQKHKSDLDALWSNAFYLEIFLSIISFIVFLLIESIFNALSGISVTILLLIFLNIFGNIMSSLWLAKSKFENNYLIPSLLVIIQSILSFVFAILFALFLDNHVHGRILGSIIPMILLSLVASVYFFRKGNLRIDFGIIKSIFIISLPLVFHYLAQDALSQGDRIFLEEFYGKEEVAIYSLSYSLSTLPLLFVQAINSTFSPWKFRKINNKDFVSTKRMIPLFGLFVLLGTFLLTLIGPEIVSIFGGESYAFGANLLPILCSSVIAIFFYDIYSTIEFFYAKTFVASLITVLASIINIGLNFLLIPTYGSFGASITTIISYGFMAICHFISAKIILKNQENQFDYFNDKFMFLFFILGISIINLVVLLYNYFLLRIIIFSIFIILIILIVILKRKFIFNLIKRKDS